MIVAEEEFHHLLSPHPTLLVADPDPLSPPQEYPQPLPPRYAIDRLPTIAVSLPMWPCQCFGSTANNGKLSDTERHKFALQEPWNA
jgi:hypothetical protein